MSAQANAPVIVIKRKKIIAGGGHHGGAWKVAYADFVTAMMAFFMLLWLLNATTENQRKGLADYFSPTIPLARVSGGGDGAFGGDSVFTEDTLARNGTGAAIFAAAMQEGPNTRSSEEDDNLSEIESMLSGGGGESLVMDNAMNHIVTRVTDEGLIIELFDLDDAHLFEDGSTTPTPLLKQISKMLVDILVIVSNEVAVNGHTRAHAIVLAQNPVWDLSSARADQLRRILEGDGFDGKRIQRVTGYADRKPAVTNPMAFRNNRLELILLRSDK
ncbi:flagellar motor protein MotB [Profundibacter sp.]